jgi:hypothetical protein
LTARKREKRRKMHIGSQLVDVDPNHEKELNPSVGLDAMRPPQFSTQQHEMDWHRDCQHAVERQGFAWAVAPQCQVLARSGLLLQAGSEVVPGQDLTHGQIHTLYRRGVLLRGTPEGQRVAACPPDARYVAAQNQAISSSEGQLLAGAEAKPEWFDSQAFALLLHRGIVVDRDKPPVSQLPADVTLREREADLDRAKADVQTTIDALAERDDAKTQKAYVDAKLHLDLAGVRVDHARKAVEAAKVAEAKRQRADLERQIADLEQQIKTRDAEVAQFRNAELAAVLKLSDALHASHAHDDGTYQLRIQRNARFADLNGGEPKQENMPGTRLHQQIMALAATVGVDPKHLNGKK